MAIVFDEVSGEIAPTPRAGDIATPPGPGSQTPTAADAEALHRALIQRERLLARLSAD